MWRWIRDRLEDIRDAIADWWDRVRGRGGEAADEAELREEDDGEIEEIEEEIEEIEDELLDGVGGEVGDEEIIDELETVADGEAEEEDELLVVEDGDGCNEARGPFVTYDDAANYARTIPCPTWIYSDGLGWWWVCLDGCSQ